VPVVLGLVPIVVEALLPWPWDGVVPAGLDEPGTWLLVEPDGWDPAAGGVGEELTAPDSLAGGDAAEFCCGVDATAWEAGLELLAAPGWP